MNLQRSTASICSVIAISSIATQASAASFLYNVNYDDAGVATLGTGSDDLQAIDLVAGDRVIYTLTATGLNRWRVLNNIQSNVTFAVLASDSASRQVDVDLFLKLNGTSVFSQSDRDINNSFTHLGPNTTSLSAGLQFNQVVFDLTLLSAVDPDDANINVGTRISSLLPILGPPQQQDGIVFGPSEISAVPEPATWALMILGLGVTGAAMRRERKANVKVSYA